MIFNDNTVDTAAQAMQALLSQQLSTIGYDKTLVYTITDDSNKEKGSYTVSDGSVTFIAYSEDTKYRKEDKVYITIPQGDFTQKKIIVGRYLETSEDEQGISYIAPIDRIIPAKTYTKYDFGVIADDIILDQEEYKVVPTEAFGGVFSSYTVRNKLSNDYECALLELKLHNYLDKYNIQEGSFGVKVILITGEKKLELGETYRPHLLTEASTEEKTYKFISLATALKNNSNHFEKLLEQVTLHNEIVKNNSWLKIEQKFCELQCHQYDFSSKDMMGNIFGYSGIQNQSVLIDISELSNIIFGSFVLYQSADFKILDLNEKKSLGKKYQEVYSKEGQFDFETYQNQMERNIWIEELSLTFGYKQNSYTDTNILKLSTINSSYFIPATTELEDNDKALSLDWISFNNKIKKYELVAPNSLEDLEDYAVFWYESDPGAGDYLSGLGWKQFNTTQKYSILSTSYCPISYDSAKKVKAVLVKRVKSENPNMNTEEKTWVKLAESNPIEFLNEDLVKESSGVLWIEITDEQKDFLGLYDDNYKIINYEDYSKIRTLKVTIPETREYTKLRLDWFIPKYGTMLQPVKKEKNINAVYNYYSDSSELQINENDDYYIISKIYNNLQGINIKEYKQSFGIEQYFQPSFIRNQIICKAYYDDDMTYCDEGRINLSFGQINSNGTIYQFGIQFNDYNKPYITYNVDEGSYSECSISCFLTSKAVSLTEEQKKGYLESCDITSLDGALTVSPEENKNWKVIVNTKNTPERAGIVKATIEIEGQILTSYLPIPIRKYSDGDTKIDIKGMQGTTNIKYNSYGELLNTTLYPLKLYGTYQNQTSESITQTYQNPIQGSYKIMSQFKESISNYGKFVPINYIFKFTTTSNLEFGKSYTIVATSKYEETEKATSPSSNYSHQLLMVVGENKTCAFYGHRNSKDMTSGDLCNSDYCFYVYGITEGNNYARIAFEQIETSNTITPFMYCSNSTNKLNISSKSEKKIYKAFSPSEFSEYEVGDTGLYVENKNLYDHNQKGKLLCPLYTLLTEEDLPDLSNNWEDINIKFGNTINITNPEKAKKLIEANNHPINYIKFYSEFGGALGEGHYSLDENDKQIIIQPENMGNFFAIEPDFVESQVIIPPGSSLPVSWTISTKDRKIEGNDIQPGDPIIKQDEKDYFVQPFPIYTNYKNSQGKEIEEYYLLTAWSGNNWLWQQPILISQNKYEFEILNQWNGETNITDTSIMSPCIGAGSKNSENQFSGVLMGKIKDGSGQTNHGLYGFSDGAQAFGFKENGTAFIGKSGSGRIIFDGTRGVITSAEYGVTGKNGMLLDLDDPKLDLHYQGKSVINFNPKSNTMILNSSNTYDLKNAEGNIISSSPKFSLDLNEGTLKAIDFSLFAGDESYIQSGSGRGLSINSKVNGKPPLFVGYDKLSDNLPFDYPSFQIGWNGDIEAKDLNLNGLKVNNSTLSFDSKLNWYNSTSFFGSLEMGRITFTAGDYIGESYILYFNMEGTSSSTTFFIDIRPNFEKTSGLNYYNFCVTEKSTYKKDNITYVVPRMQWKGKTSSVITWSETSDGKLGEGVLAFTDFTKPNCVVESQNVSSIYFRFLILDLSSDDNRLGFATDRLSASWAIIGEGTKDTKLSTLWASQLIAGFANMSEYSCNFSMSGVTDLTDNFIDIQVNMTSGGTILSGPDKVKTEGFSVDAFGHTKISSLEVGKEVDGKLTYVSLADYIRWVISQP